MVLSQIQQVKAKYTIQVRGKAPLYRRELELGIFDIRPRRQDEQFVDATARNSFNMGWLNHMVASFRSAGDVDRDVVLR
jgi:hypothetical protein